MRLGFRRDRKQAALPLLQQWRCGVESIDVRTMGRQHTPVEFFSSLPHHFLC